MVKRICIKSIIVVAMLAIYFKLESILRPILQGEVVTAKKLSNTAESFMTQPLYDSIWNVGIPILLGIIMILIFYREIKSIANMIFDHLNN